MRLLKSLIPYFIAFLIVLGLGLRLYHISDNQFLFYDEGMYLGYNRAFLNLVANNPARDFSQWAIIVTLMFKTALTTAKALWFFILNLRVFILGPEAWYFARWVSALSGLATVVIIFFWAKRYFQSLRIAWLSALVLLILPSHVFYSRLGMQESLSALLFVSALWMYGFSLERMRLSFFVSVVLLACVYFTNYRMILAPIFIVFIECFQAFLVLKNPRALLGRGPRIFFYSLIFYGIVLFIGSLYGSVNLHANLAWMLHQAKDAGGKFHWINFLSYPYYVFALEGFFLACFFWGNGYLILLKEYAKLLPFGIVLFQMLIFSFAAEKGARYLCVVLPFMSVAVAVVVDTLWAKVTALRWGLLAAGFLACGSMILFSGAISCARTDYQAAVDFIHDQDPNAQIIATQPLVESLFLPEDKRLLACPDNGADLIRLYKQGARYLILDPQAYISWTSNARRFSPPLDDFLNFIVKNAQPVKTFPHLNSILLKRFVLDHNEQLMDSISFLSQAKMERYGEIRIYDLRSIFGRNFLN